MPIFNHTCTRTLRVHTRTTRGKVCVGPHHTSLSHGTSVPGTHMPCSMLQLNLYLVLQPTHGSSSVSVSSGILSLSPAVISVPSPLISSSV